jgi:hypothetical protein
VAESPKCADEGGLRERTLTADDGGDGDDVIGVSGMAHAEEEPDYQDGEAADHSLTLLKLSTARMAVPRDSRIDENACETRDLRSAVASGDCAAEDEPQSHRGHREKSRRRNKAHSNARCGGPSELLFVGAKEHNPHTAEARRNEGPMRSKEKSMKRIVWLVAVLIAAVFAHSAVAQDNPMLGTWKLNLAKSKFEGGPAPKSLTRTITADGSGAKYSFEGVSADGKPFAYSFSTNYDGKDSPVTGTGMPFGADSITLKRISPSKTEGILKKGGKEVGKVVTDVSKDGKIATVKAKGKGPDGKEAMTDSIYDKQ